MTTGHFNLANVHPSWLACIKQGLAAMDVEYLNKLSQSNTWLPGPDNIFNAFSIPLDKVNYVLLGESPYPRQTSANGYAFWDANVGNLWSESGLSKQVNRATSMRNIIKMLLVADGKLSEQHTTQDAIAQLNKNHLLQSNDEFFNNLLSKGFLLLNTSLVLQDQAVNKDAKAWLPFIKVIISHINKERPQAHYLLFGRIANTIEPLLPKNYPRKLVCEHPYNVSFISNKKVLSFFRPLNLLSKQE